MSFEPCEIKRKTVRVLIEYVRKTLLKIMINLSCAITLSDTIIKVSKWAIFSACRPRCYSKIEIFLGDISFLLRKYLCKYGFTKTTNQPPTYH